jgi:hypothetical protein
MALIEALEKAQTRVSAIDMIKAAIILVVTANAEQMPNTCNVMGLLSINGSTTLVLA